MLWSHTQQRDNHRQSNTPALDRAPLWGAGKGSGSVPLRLSKIHQLSNLPCTPELHQLLRTRGISAQHTLSHRNSRTKKENSSRTHCTVSHPTDVLQNSPEGRSQGNSWNAAANSTLSQAASKFPQKFLSPTNVTINYF